MAVGRCLIGGLCMLLLAYAGIVSTSESEQQLRKLTDQNFEHDTQAATGQTTGHWFALFSSPAAASWLKAACAPRSPKCGLCVGTLFLNNGLETLACIWCVARGGRAGAKCACTSQR